MHALTSHQLTTPIVERGRFGLGTSISPCSIAAYQQFPGRREECERQAEYYRSQLSQKPSPAVETPRQLLIPIALFLTIPAAIFLLGRASKS